MIRYFLLFLLSIFASQSWYAIAAISVTTYQYDTITKLITHENTELRQQNFVYDDTQNLQYCCSESWGNLQEEKAVSESFFVLLGNFIVTKSAGKELTTFFPPNNGFLSSATKATLKPGQTIDRFGGSDVSRFFSPTGTPAAMRSLPPGTASQPLRSFEVLKPIAVESGRVAPAFNQIGLGTQFRSGKQLGELLDGGFLRGISR